MKWLTLVLALLFGPHPSQSPSISSAPIPTPTPASVLYQVPFTSQAPFSNWKDPRQQDACEEASVLMAIKWATNQPIISKSSALNDILALAKYQADNFGSYHDTSTTDTVTRLFKGFYQLDIATVKTDIKKTDIISALQSGYLVITPMNGRLMGNKFFTPPGPDRHNVLIIGYDVAKKVFITNDPGVTNGASFTYPEDVFYEAIRDYPTGNHQPITTLQKNMIVVTRP